MIGGSFSKQLRKDRNGAVAVEFALLAPALIAMFLGVLMLGLYMQNYNSIRSLAFDVERYTIVEYQKDNQIAPAQISQVAIAIASSAPYNFNEDRFSAGVEEASIDFTGAKKYVLTVSYTPSVISSIMNLRPPTITQTRSIIVPD